VTTRPRRCAALASVACEVFGFEDQVHDRRAADRGEDHIRVDGLGDVSGPVADGFRDLLNRDAVVARDRDRSMTSLVDCHWPRPSRLVILLNRQMSASCAAAAPPGTSAAVAARPEGGVRALS
jgi:hypothetical protein